MFEKLRLVIGCWVVLLLKSVDGCMFKSCLSESGWEEGVELSMGSSDYGFDVVGFVWWGSWVGYCIVDEFVLGLVLCDMFDMW